MHCVLHEHPKLLQFLTRSWCSHPCIFKATSLHTQKVCSVTLSKLCILLAPTTTHSNAYTEPLCPLVSVARNKTWTIIVGLLLHTGAVLHILYDVYLGDQTLWPSMSRGGTKAFVATNTEFFQSRHWSYYSCTALMICRWQWNGFHWEISCNWFPAGVWMHQTLVWSRFLPRK